MTTATEELVDLLLGIDGETLPESTRDAVLRNSLQIFGIARLGLENPVAARGVETTARLEAGRGATIVGWGHRTATAPAAAFANSLASHADFREDTHSGSSSHPGVVVMPAVLAAAETTGRPLPENRYVEAVVAGHEMIARVAAAALADTIARGFRPPSVYTVFGGTVAAGIVLGLSAEQHVHALAIAAQGASGINHPFFAGTDEWFLAPAFATRHALTSALLAQAGIEGSPRALDGEEGIFETFAGSAFPLGLRPIGLGGYEIERARLKAALTCGWNQSLVHQLRTLAPAADTVESIRIRMSPVAAEYPGVAKTTNFRTRSEALLSAPYASALALVRGTLDHSGYTCLANPDLLAFAGCVEVTSDPDLTGYATTVDVKLTDGRVLHSQDGNDDPKFSLNTTEKVLATLRTNYRSAGYDTGLVDTLAEAVRALVESGSVDPLTEALGAPRPHTDRRNEQTPGR